MQCLSAEEFLTERFLSAEGFLSVQFLSAEEFLSKAAQSEGAQSKKCLSRVFLTEVA